MQRLLVDLWYKMMLHAMHWAIYGDHDQPCGSTLMK